MYFHGMVYPLFLNGVENILERKRNGLMYSKTIEKIKIAHKHQQPFQRNFRNSYKAKRYF